MLEFSLAAPIFFAMVFVVVQTSLVAYSVAKTDYAVGQAMEVLIQEEGDHTAHPYPDADAANKLEAIFSGAHLVTLNSLAIGPAVATYRTDAGGTQVVIFFAAWGECFYSLDNGPIPTSPKAAADAAFCPDGSGAGYDAGGYPLSRRSTSEYASCVDTGAPSWPDPCVEVLLTWSYRFNILIATPYVSFLEGRYGRFEPTVPH